jgi:Tfp pilus assembly protein PilX
MPHFPARLASQQGTVLFTAVVALMILAVISLSFVALAGFEIRIGMNHREGLEALNLAESAIQHGRSLIMASTALNFTSWVNSADNGMVLLNALSGPGGGTYSVRVDNNCSANVTGPGLTADTGCATNTDGDRTAIMTAWATSGTGRARIRIWLQSTDSWKHACYDGDGTLCTDNSNGDIFPSDPEDPNGPATGPMPQLSLPLVCGGDVRTPAGITLTSGQCVIQPYYDLALATDCLSGSPMECSPQQLKCDMSVPFVAGNMNGTCGPAGQSGLVFFGNSSDWLRTADVEFKASGGGKRMRCAGDHQSSVYSALNPAHPSPSTGSIHNGCPGTANTSVVVYVMGKARIGNGGEVNGTLVVHGDGQGGGGPNMDFEFTGQGSIFTIPPTGSPCNVSLICGYPLALLIYDPMQAAPTSAGQNTRVDLSDNNSLVNGIVYSSGLVDFNPVTIWGGVIGWNVHFQSAAAEVTYTGAFGNAAPPPGFTVSGVSSAKMMRNTYAQCRYYADQVVPTACND